MAGLWPLAARPLAKKAHMGVLPLPPEAMFPTETTGIPARRASKSPAS
jgi:hypothetical protein